MFIDASAIVAMLVDEPEAASLRSRVKGAAVVVVSPIAVYEATLAITRIKACPVASASRVVAEFVDLSGAEIMPIDEEIGEAAVDAFNRFGKGRHPAALNMGDCFAYACARSRAMPLLCKGDDFARTDALLA